MLQKYLLPCPCGISVEIEASQAGQQITCTACGAAQQVPSLLQIKKLPMAEEAVHPAERPEKLETGNMRRAFFWIGLVIFAPSLLFLLWAVFVSRPLPRDVWFKRVEFTFGQNKVTQDSTPISGQEHFMLWIRPEDIDLMSPIELYFHFLHFQAGPNFSFNFQENYQALKEAWYLRMATGGVLTFLGLLSLVSSFFMPRRNAVVTGWSGTEWS